MLRKGIIFAFVLLMLSISACGKKGNQPTDVENEQNSTSEVTKKDEMQDDNNASKEESDSMVESDTSKDNGSTNDNDVVVENFFDDDKNTSSNEQSKNPSKEPSKEPSANQKPTETKPITPTTDYERFLVLSPVEQQKYMESFESIEKFFDWYNDEKEKYEKEHPSIEIDGGAIDLDKIINGN